MPAVTKANRRTPTAQETMRLEARMAEREKNEANEPLSACRESDAAGRSRSRVLEDSAKPPYFAFLKDIGCSSIFVRRRFPEFEALRTRREDGEGSGVWRVSRVWSLAGCATSGARSA